MRHTTRLLISTSALVIMIGAIFLSMKPLGQEALAQERDDFAMYYLWVYCEPSQAASATFAAAGTGSMGTHVACAGWCSDGGIKRKVMIADALAKLPPKVSAALTEKLRQHERDAAAGIGNSIAGCGSPAPPKPQCEKYSGTITCDCNGDGQDDSTQSFESCGDPSNRPRGFKSRCEDWVTGDGGFTYATDIGIQRQASEYLKGLRCPALKCSQDYKACDDAAQGRFEKCSFGKKFLGVNRRCTRNLTNDINKCRQNRTQCLKASRRSGTAARFQPTPSAGFEFGRFLMLNARFSDFRLEDILPGLPPERCGQTH